MSTSRPTCGSHYYDLFDTSDPYSVGPIFAGMAGKFGQVGHPEIRSRRRFVLRFGDAVGMGPRPMTIHKQKSLKR